MTSLELERTTNKARRGSRAGFVYHIGTYAPTINFDGLMDAGGWKQADMANRYRKIAPAGLGEDLFKHGWNFTNEPAPIDRDREAPRVFKL